MRDSEIEQWVLRELARQRNSYKEICVCATAGIVTLQGTVRTRYERSNAQKAALRARSVTSVVNSLKVLRPDPPIERPIRPKVSLRVNQYPRPTASSVAGTPRP